MAWSKVLNRIGEALLAVNQTEFSKTGKAPKLAVYIDVRFLRKITASAYEAGFLRTPKEDELVKSNTICGYPVYTIDQNTEGHPPYTIVQIYEEAPYEDHLLAAWV